MSEPEIRIAPDPDSLADLAADHVAAALREAVAARGVAHLALTGGSTATGLYVRLAGPPHRDAIPWSQVQLWWGDDRYVPVDHPASNTGLVESTLLHVGAMGGESDDGTAGIDVRGEAVTGVVLAAQQVHPFPIAAALAEGRDAAWTAQRYADLLRAAIPHDAGGWPVFDLVLLGMGPDGHILSCFPGSPALSDETSLALAVPAPTTVEPHLPRVTLNPRLVTAARAVLVVVSGDAKAERVREVLAGPRDLQRLPAQYARRAGATWLLDAAAASRMPGQA
jgi:6-phosphogluconolactonase